MGRVLTVQGGHASLQNAEMFSRMKVRGDGKLYITDQPFFTQAAYIDQVIDQTMKKRMSALAGEAFLLTWLGRLPPDFKITKKQCEQLKHDLTHLQEFYREILHKNMFTHRDLFKSLDVLGYTFYWPEEHQSNNDRLLPCEELKERYQLARHNITHKGGSKEVF